MITQAAVTRLGALAHAISDGPLAVLPVGLALFDTGLRYLAVNETLAAINGVPAADHLGRHVTDVLPEVDAVTVEHLRTVVETGQPFRGGELCFPVPASPGEPRWWLESYEPVADEAGAVVAVLATVTDITDRKRAEEQERRSAAFLNQALAHLPVGVVLVDPAGVQVSQNEAVKRIWRSDMALTTVAERTAGRVFRPSGEPYLPEDLPIMRSAREGESVVGETVRFVRHDGTEGWASVSSAPVDNIEGVRLGAVALIEDITEQRQAEASRDAFLGMLAHEMRTPLSVVIGNAELLVRRRDLSPERQLEAAQDIAADANRLSRSIEDLLVLSRVERGVDLKRTDPVHVMHVIRRVLAEEERQRPGQLFGLESPPVVPLAAGDETYTAHALGNLLSNAAKYGGGTVGVRVEGADGRVVVRVLDDGPGFAAGDEDRVFDLFYRSPLTAGRAPGAGVGLFVVRALITAQGGSVWARTRPEGGAEVGFSLCLFDEE